MQCLEISQAPGLTPAQQLQLCMDSTCVSVRQTEYNDSSRKVRMHQARYFKAFWLVQCNCKHVQMDVSMEINQNDTFVVTRHLAPEVWMKDGNLEKESHIKWSMTLFGCVSLLGGVPYLLVLFGPVYILQRPVWYRQELSVWSCFHSMSETQLTRSHSSVRCPCRWRDSNIEPDSQEHPSGHRWDTQKYSTCQCFILQKQSCWSCWQQMSGALSGCLGSRATGGIRTWLWCHKLYMGLQCGISILL